MKLAIADPPYPPQTSSGGTRGRASRWYGDRAHTLGPGSYAADNHPDAAEWDDPARHRQLIEQLLDEYDGFAIATTPDGIDAYLPLPAPAKRMAWVRPNAMPGPSRVHSLWEAVILYPPLGRRTSRGGVGTVPNVLVAPKENTGFAGTKPASWTRWVLDAMSYDPTVDEVVDLFRGSGAVSDTLAQSTLDLTGGAA